MSCEDNSGYQPSPIVTAFHSIPHIDINLQPVSADFSVSLNYFQPIIIWACVPVLACVCLFILLSVYYICICCCCCCRDKKARPKVTKIICAFFVCLVILFCCGMIGASIYAEVELNSFINSFIRDAQGVDQTVDVVTAELNSYPSGSVGSALQSIASAIESSSAPDAERMVASRAVSDLITVNGQIGLRISEVNSSTLSVDINSALNTMSFIETIRHWSVIGYLAFIVVILLIVFLVTVCMSPIGMVIMLVFLGILTLTVWIAVGGSLASVVVLSDICVDPDNLIRNNTPADARDIVDYYISCTDTCPNPFGEDLNALQQLAEQSQANLTQLENFNDMYNLNQQDNIMIVQAGLMTGRSVAINATSLLTCMTNSGIHQDYRSALDSLCTQNGGFVYALVLFALSAGLAVSLLLLMCCVTGFAGLLANTRPDEVDRDDFLALETEHTVAWNNRRASYTEPYSSSANGTSSYRTVREDYPMQPIGNTLGVVEPPKYSDLNAPRQPGRPNSGDYDHFDA